MNRKTCQLVSEIRLAEPRDGLVHAGRIEHRQIERQRLADPLGERGVVGEIIVSQGMNERRESGEFDQPDHRRQRSFEKVDLELRLGMRAQIFIAHRADEEDAGEAAGARGIRESSMQSLGARSNARFEIDVRVIVRVIDRHWMLSLPAAASHGGLLTRNMGRCDPGFAIP